jgi:hypothetical protein
MSKAGIAIAGILSLSMGAVSVYLWLSLGQVDMGVAGYLALIGGGVATLGLGVGLMALMFYSSRAGFDEAAGASPLAHKPPHDAEENR